VFLRNIGVMLVLFTFFVTGANSGTLIVFDYLNSPGIGTVRVKANAIKKVSLSLSDSVGNNLVSASGVDFGDVDTDGNTSSTGVTGVSLGVGKAEYLATFVFNVSRTGSGNISLLVQRSVAGNFNSADGVVIQDDAGASQALSGTGNQVTVVDNRPEGTFAKGMGVRIYDSDAGNLSTILLFTASAL